MSRADFIEQLKNLGYRLDSVTPQGFVVFDYEIPIGSKRGEKIKLAFAVGEDFPLNPPGGPHVSPRLLPMHTSNDLPHPHGAVHPSDQLGPSWEYWSRPFPGWNSTDRTVRAYLGYIRRLFADV